MIEVWKPIPGYEGRYEASTHGRIKTLSQRPGIRRLRHDNRGYQYLDLHAASGSHRWRVNRLILTTFVSPAPPDRPVAAHRNGIKSDNRLENLVWATFSENTRHTDFHGTRKRGSQRSNSKLSEDVVAQIKKRMLSGDGPTLLARQFGASVTQIKDIRSGRSWRHVKADGSAMTGSELWPETENPMVVS